MIKSTFIRVHGMQRSIARVVSKTIVGIRVYKEDDPDASSLSPSSSSEPNGMFSLTNVGSMDGALAGERQAHGSCACPMIESQKSVG